MMEKNKKRLIKVLKYTFIIIGIIFLVSFISNTVVLADVGNNNRYDTTDSSSSYSGGGDFYFDFGWIIYILFELFGPIPGIILLLILLGVFIWASKTGRLKKFAKQVSHASHTNLHSEPIGVDNTNMVANKIREIDPNFSEDDFLGWVREVFLKMQQAWTERNWKIIRPFESEELFSQHNAQLEEYIRNNKINKVEKININFCTLRDFKIDGDKEVLTVELHAIMRDYVVDATTNKVLESDPNKDWHMNYFMTFNRKVGVKTEAGISNKSTTNCPNCGAPTEITSAGQCEYCKSVITTGDHDWVLSDIRSIH